jgi:hypothetical protein
MATANPDGEAKMMRELYTTPPELDDPRKDEADPLDQRPSARQPALTLADKMTAFANFTAALRRPENAAVAKPFIRASIAIFVVPLVIFNLVLYVVLPMLGHGSDAAIDETALLGMDRNTFSAVCALASVWVIMAAYTVHAVAEEKEALQRDEAKRKAVAPQDAETKKKTN